MGLGPGPASTKKKQSDKEFEGYSNDVKPVMFAK
jgi:hypothetical protein